MKRNIGDFDVTWAGAFIQAKRNIKPRHVYEYDVTDDRRAISKLYWTAPGLVEGPRNPLFDIQHFEGDARKAAEEFLRLEQGSPPMTSSEDGNFS